MQTNFSVGGFLFHPTKQTYQLRHKPHDQDVQYSLFSWTSTTQTNPLQMFQQSISEEMNITIPFESITPVYDYIHQETQKAHYIYYIDLLQLDKKTIDQLEKNTHWFTAKQLTKLKLHQQTIHDMMIGQRVIRAAVEKLGTAV